MISYKAMEVHFKPPHEMDVLELAKFYVERYKRLHRNSLVPQDVFCHHFYALADKLGTDASDKQLRDKLKGLASMGRSWAMPSMTCEFLLRAMKDNVLHLQARHRRLAAAERRTAKESRKSSKARSV